MKRFCFKLRSVSVLRAHAELRAREALAAALSVQAGAESAHAAARVRLSQLEQAVCAGRSGRYHAGRAAAELLSHQQAIAECAAALQRLREAGAAVNQQRRDYLAAQHRVKIMDRLQATARTEHRAETARSEQGELDAMVGRRPLRILSHP